MDVKTGIGWSLIIVAVTLAFCLAVKPLIMKEPIEEVAESELFYSGEDTEGEHWYWVFKKEVKDWITILSPLFSIGLMGGGIWLKNRRKKNGNTR